MIIVLVQFKKHLIPLRDMIKCMFTFLLERQPIPLAVIVMKMMSYWYNQLEKSLMSLRMNRVFD